jgi:uncharacterized protein YfiM (DUF2279 family)
MISNQLVKKNFVAFYICLFTFFTVSNCATFHNHCGDSFFGKDKLYHFTATGIIGAGTTAVANNNGISKHSAPVVGISTAVGIGAGKEWYDTSVKKTYWSWKDMIWDLIGGSAGSYLVQNK